MKNISGYIFSLLLCAVPIADLQGQDTLRSYGPVFATDISRLAYLFADPQQTGGEISVDMEVFRNVYPVVEAGYNRTTERVSGADYRSSGVYGRIGLGYNLLKVPDRSEHHALMAGLLFGSSFFTHRAENIVVPGEYWGDWEINSYENSPRAYWMELTGSIRAELSSNFFMGWSIRYRVLLNPDMDPQVAPLLIPGYGRGSEDRSIGFTYSVGFKIPLLKK